jgi:3-ketosteroid 9alpha-monooxygenase subunit A
MMNGAVWAPLQALSGRRGRNDLNPRVESAREATYPRPYPEGWYVVGRSTDIRGRPTFVQCVGNQWVVFRDASGTARVVDAYCPHLGANLADGKVRGDCVECPFHGWKIRGDGRVVGQASGERPDPRHRTRSWVVEELHGWVLVYHRHGASVDGPTPEPPYRLQRVPEIDDGDLVWRGEHDAGLVHMHLLEFRGKAITGSGAHADVRIEGPGSFIRFDFTLTRGRGRVVLYQSHTPISPMTQHVRFRWFSGRNVPKPLASFIVGNWVSQWCQDIGIWERKIYRKNPMLTRADGPIHQLRRWYAQFYPAASQPAERPE